MLRMQFAGVMAMILMGTGYGWRLLMVVVVLVAIPLQEIDIVVIAMVGVDVEYPDVLNIVFLSMDCPPLHPGRILRITCEKQGMFAFHKFFMMEGVPLGL
jgi:hypothetical protein